METTDMLLFRCECGESHRVDSKYAGGTLDCPCGKTIIIPAQSDENLFLLYTTGRSEEGFALSLTELQDKLASHEMSEIDLVRREGAWVPLSAVFDIEMPLEIDEELPQEESIIDDLQPLKSVTSAMAKAEKVEAKNNNVNKIITKSFRKKEKKKITKKTEKSKKKDEKKDSPKDSKDENKPQESSKKIKLPLSVMIVLGAILGFVVIIVGYYLMYL